MRLLLAEDERELSRALVTILEHSSYTVDAVYNGADALDYLRSGLYDGAIRQMVGLLLDNAVKYADSDGDITLMLMWVGKRVELTVTNPCRSVAEGVHDQFGDGRKWDRTFGRPCGRRGARRQGGLPQSGRKIGVRARDPAAPGKMRTKQAVPT